MAIHLFDSIHESPGVKLPVRSVFVTEQGRGIIISPVNFTEEQVQKIRSVGKVTDLVAPCLFHHVAMPKAINYFPEAKTWCVPGLEKKRSDIAWDFQLTPETWAHKDVLDILALGGVPNINEVEFFHRPTKTLIATDICFNLRKPRGLAASIVLRAMGTYDGFAISRLFKTFVTDKTRFEKSLSQLFQWDFDKIVMSHGDPVEFGGKELLKQALSARGFKVV